MFCKECGKNMDEHSDFCPFCGNPPDSKIICMNCSHQNVGEYLFCEKCGKRLETKRTFDASILKTIFRHITTGMFMLVLILLFAACFTPIYHGKLIDFDELDKFYHYFYQIFKDYGNKSSANKHNSEIIYAIISSVVVIGNLIITSFTVIFGLIKGIRALTLNKDSKLEKIVGFAFASSLVFVIWFGSYFPTFEGLYIGPLYLIALILAACFMIINMVFNAILHYEDFIKKIHVTNLATNLVAVTFALVAIIFLGKGIYSATLVVSDIVDIRINFSFYPLYELIDYNFHTNGLDSSLLEENVMAIIQAFIFLIAIIVGSLLITFKLISISNNTYQKEVKSNQLILSIIFALCVISLLVLSLVIISSTDVKTLSIEESDIKSIKLNAGLIGALVLAIQA